MTKSSKSPIHIDPSKKGSLGAVTGKNKDGTVKQGNVDKIANAKKNPETGKYPKVEINGKEKQVTPALKKKAIFAENASRWKK